MTKTEKIGIMRAIAFGFYISRPTVAEGEKILKLGQWAKTQSEVSEALYVNGILETSEEKRKFDISCGRL